MTTSTFFQIIYANINVLS